LFVLSRDLVNIIFYRSKKMVDNQEVYINAIILHGIIIFFGLRPVKSQERHRDG
jgi:hypothetical protein